MLLLQRRAPTGLCPRVSRVEAGLSWCQVRESQLSPMIAPRRARQRQGAFRCHAGRVDLPLPFLQVRPTLQDDAIVRFATAIS